MNLESTLSHLRFWERAKDAHRHARVQASAIASLLRGFSGGRVVELGARPEKRLVLYEIENCPYSRKVREALSALDLDVDVRPCPIGAHKHRAELESIGGKPEVPMLVDPNTMEVLYDSTRIVAYLFERYGHGERPFALRAGRLGDLTSKLATRLRAGAGLRSEPAVRPELPLELWSYEASAEARLAREVLSTLALPYVLHNVAHGSRKLHELEQRAGSRHVPFLYDPNRDVGSTGAGNIMAYLRETYGRGSRHFRAQTGQPVPTVA